MKKIFIIIIIVVVLGGAGWYFYRVSQQPGTQPKPATKSLTLAQVETATNNSISLNNSGTPLVAFGDINADGAGDAAAIVPNTAAGTGDLLETFLFGAGASLAEAGQPVFAATTSDLRLPPLLSQSAIGTILSSITGLSISNGIVAVSGTAATTSSTDAALAPAAIQYKLVSGMLVKVGPAFSIPSLLSGVSAIGVGKAWSTYTDAADRVQFDYPNSVVNAYTNTSDIKQIKSYLPIGSDAKLVLALPPSQYPASTTVHDAFIVISATPAPDFPTCISAVQNDSSGGYSAAPVEVAITPPGTGLIAPVNFYQFPGVTGGGCWAGGCAFGTLFATYQNGTCYQFGLQAAVTDPGVYATSQSQFQQTDHNNTTFESRLFTLFYQILSTARFQ